MRPGPAERGDCRRWAIISAPMIRMLEATARAEDTHYWFRGLRRHARMLLDKALAGRRLDRIVDCGAGTGRNLDWLGEYGTAVGVEYSPVGLREAHRHGRPVVQATVAALPFADASVDLTTSFDVLYCLDDETERRALSEMWRVLKPGGLVLVNVAALDILHGAHSTLTMEVRRYTPARLASRLTGAGFRVDRMTFTYMSPLPFALAIRGFERITGRSEQPSEADLRVPPAALNTAFDAVLRVEAGLLRVMNLPVGTSLIAIARKV
jgi:SAM-dependent methyltransferase